MVLVVIELAPTGRSKCVECQRKIMKNTPRGIIEYKDDYNRDNKRYICHKCVLEEVDKEIDTWREMRRILKKLTKENIKEVMLMELAK